jgi:hypothetical protein
MHLGSIACVISAIVAAVLSCVGFDHLTTVLFSITILVDSAMAGLILDWTDPANL